MDADTVTIILAGALAVSEALSLIPGLKSNGIFKLISQIVKYMAGKKA